MDDRLRFVKHHDKTILLIDFSQGTKQEILLLLDEIRTTMAQQARDSVLSLADFSGAHMDKEVATRIKEVLTLDRPYVKRSAWVGTASLPNVFYENFKRFSQRELPKFDTRDQAMDWLAEE
jgi:hypothetical protein